MELFEQIQFLRADDGSYWTGWQFDNGKHFPHEQSTWTAAAVVLAADVLASGSAAVGSLAVPPTPAAAPDLPRRGRRAGGCAADPAACGVLPRHQRGRRGVPAATRVRNVQSLWRSDTRRRLASRSRPRSAPGRAAIQ